MIDNMIENQIADQKEATTKPGTNQEAKRISRALITRIKRPNVKTDKGKVRKTKTGFTKVFIIPRTIAKTSKLAKLETVTPGKR